jgi:hypothetical protein
MNLTKIIKCDIMLAKERKLIEKRKMHKEDE